MLKKLHPYFLFGVMGLVMASCQFEQNKITSRPVEISIEERIWITKFVSDFFVKEEAIYTLFGSKPMSEVSLCAAPKKEWLAEYASLMEEQSKADKQAALADLEEYIDQYDLLANWEKWAVWKEKYLGKNFLFTKRSKGSKNLFSLYILNVQEAAWALEHNYRAISEELGIEFDPLEVVLQFEEENSPFWNKAFLSHYVKGILFGYGERNAYFFARKMGLQGKNPLDLYIHPLFHSVSEQTEDRGDFPLPRFRSFSADLRHDPIHQKYLRERWEIIQLLKDKNRVDLILSQLGFEPGHTPEEIAFR